MLRRRMMMAKTQEKASEWLYEAYLTDSGSWYGKRCPAIVLDVQQGERYLIEWSNCRTSGKYIYDMRKCGATYLIYHSDPTGVDYATHDVSGEIEIIIPADGTLYIGVGSNANVTHGDFAVACFDGNYIRIRKE